jgi:hypothetical protein
MSGEDRSCYAEARRVFDYLEAGSAHPVNRVQMEAHRRLRDESASDIVLMLADIGPSLARQEPVRDDKDDGLIFPLAHYLELAIQFATLHRLAVAPLLWWEARNVGWTTVPMQAPIVLHASAIESMASALLQRPGPGDSILALEETRREAATGFLCAARLASSMLMPLRLRSQIRIDGHYIAHIVDRYQRKGTGR